MNLLDLFKQSEDHRDNRGKKYPLWVLMSLVVLASLSGYIGYRPIANFCQEHRQELWVLLELPEDLKCPSYSTFRRVMLETPPEQWEKVYNGWALETLPEPEESKSWAIDGKSIRATSTGGNSSEQNFISIVSIYDHDSSGVVQLQVMANKEESEIAVTRQLLEAVESLPAGQCFSLDALHTQTQTVTPLVGARHDYLIGVKLNQPTLYRVIAKLDAEAEPLSNSQLQDNTHGRQVLRTVRVYEAPSPLLEKWAGLARVIVVERQGWREGKAFHEVHYYISSLSLDASQFALKIQQHWHIENKLHWVKDVTFSEDFPARLGGHAPVNWAILNTWCITLARRLKTRTVPDALRLLANRISKVWELLVPKPYDVVPQGS